MRYLADERMESVPQTPFIMVIRSARRKLLRVMQASRELGEGMLAKGLGYDREVRGPLRARLTGRERNVPHHPCTAATTTSSPQLRKALSPTVAFLPT